MKPTLKTRKPIDQLRRIDVATFAVWEFADDEEVRAGQDETWVRPVRAKAIPIDAYSLSVAAHFIAPTGIEYEGIVGVSTAGEFEALHAAILTEQDYVFIPWAGLADAAEHARTAAKDLGLKTRDLFPLVYRLAVHLEGESARREGVYSYENDA